MGTLTRFVRGLVAACCAALELSAGAATVSENEGVYTVINTVYNNSNFGWTGVTSFTVTLPVRDGVFAEGDTYALSSIQIVKASSGNNDNNNTPATLTIAGVTATRSDATGVDAAWDGGRTVSTYTFTGTKPILTVGSAATVATTGPGTLRACPTIQRGDTDLLIGIGNDQYQPLTKVVCEKITTTTAEITTDTDGVSEITWSNGAPSETNPGVLTIGEGVTLSVAALTDLNYVTLAGAGTLKVTSATTIERNYTSPVVFGAAWAGTLHLVGVTMKYCDFNKFVGVGKVKVTGAAGYFDDEKAFPGELILEDDGETKALTINNGDSGHYYAIQTLSGSGTFLCTNQAATQQTIIKSAANFTGTVTVEGTGKSVVFADVGGYQSNCNGSIVIGGGANVTIAEGKTWSAGNKILINANGTLTVPASFASEFKGSGKLAGYTAFTQVTDTVKTSLQAETWTGSLVVTNATIQNGAVTSDKTTLNAFGNANSKIEFAGTCNGYFGLSRKNLEDVEVAILPELVISGALALNNGYTQRSDSLYYYTLINKLSGTGALSCSNGNINQLLFVKDGASYAGSITATNLKVVFGEPAETMALVANNTLTIAEGQTATVASGKAFKAAAGITVDGALTVADGATEKGLENNLTIGKNGTVTVNRNDWIKWDVGSAQTIKVVGTLDCGTHRQSFGANNMLVVVAGATITGVGDGEGAIDNFGGSKITIEADPSETDPATEVTWSATVRYRGQPELEVAEGVTLNMTGDVIVDRTNAKTVTKTGAGVLKLMGEVSELVTHKLTAGTIVSNVEGLTVTVEEGSTLYSQADDGVTTYQLTPFDPVGPTSWDDVTAADLPAAFADISADGLAALKTWAKGVGAVALADRANVNEICFLLNIANDPAVTTFNATAEDIAAVIAGGVAELQKLYPNAKVTLVAVEGLPETCFRVKLSLSTAPAAE